MYELLSDCSEGYKTGTYSLEAIYSIMPPFTNTSFPVRCVMKYGGRTIVQLRNTTEEDFYRNWTAYRNGFGSLDADFWLGLEHIYQIVRDRNVDLVVLMKLGNGVRYQRRYFDFRVSGERDGYRMVFSKSRPTAIHPLGDSLLASNGSKFSTADVDNDNLSDGNCARIYQSGFWFNACADCNPNGRLLWPPSGQVSRKEEVFWENDLGEKAPFLTKFSLVVP